MTNEDESPLLVTGEDSIIYQVADKNVEGHGGHGGEDGEQQCLLVLSEDEQGVLHMVAGEQHEGDQ